MEQSICLSIFIHKPWLVNEGGLNMRVAYPMNFFPDKNKTRSNISRATSDRVHFTLFSCKHPFLFSNVTFTLNLSFIIEDVFHIFIN